jgi:hypothetical protein
VPRTAVAWRLVFVAGLAAMVAAVPLQQLALPLGLFNTGREAYRAASWAAAALLLAGLGVLVAELRAGRALRLAGAVRGLLVAWLLLEALLAALDVTLVSRGAARLGGPYREVRGPDGGWVTLKKPRPGSPLGFRTDGPWPRRGEPATGALRVLFLGDSYTEGSGRALACNYPEVAGETLAARLGRPVRVLNAGVAGAGPVEALGVLRLLASEDVAFDAVVFGLFLENDFTDDLPATVRRVVAGMSFRFPASPWLRALHPLNTRSFRWALFVVRAGELVRGAPAAARRDAGACDLTPARLPTPLPGALRALVRRRLEANYGPSPRSADAVVERAVAELRAQAARLGVPFVLVVFPDRILVDEALRARLDLDPARYDLGRLARLVRARLAAGPLVEAAPALAAGSENYRPDDTHLSDLGNLRAGRFVGEALAGILSRAGAGEAGEAGTGSAPGP